MALLIVLYMALLIVLYKVNKVHSINTLIGLSIDKTGITKNSYDIYVEDELRPYIYIYWLGDNGTKKQIDYFSIIKLFIKGYQTIMEKTELLLKQNPMKYCMIK